MIVILYKKFYISLLSLLLIFATAGLPLSIQFCKTMKAGEIQFCAINHLDEKNIDKPECDECSEVNNVKIAAANCCEYMPLETIVTDKYVSFKTEINHNLSLIAVVASAGSNILNSQISFTNYLQDTSPPSQCNNHLYLNNSIFLI
jgi:hypothetical protein